MNKNKTSRQTEKKPRKSLFHRVNTLMVKNPFDARIKELEEIKEATSICAVELPFDFDL